MHQISLMHCKNYEQDEVMNAVTKSIESLGGIGFFVKPGMRVLLKCNLLMKKKPEECVTTHPAVVKAIADILIRAGAKPIIFDCPGGPYIEQMLKPVYSGCGMIEAANLSGAVCNYNTGVVEVYNPGAKIAKKITIASIVKETDAIISIPKLKTHGMCLFTGAVKNMFGIIPGLVKMEYHFRMRQIDDFSDMLIDVCNYANPVLSIMDAVIGMEGNGPSAGTPRKIGAILAGTNPFALDVAATSLVGIAPGKVMTIKKAEERGYCSSKLEHIDILGDSFEKLRIHDFKMPNSEQKGLIAKVLEVGGNNRISKLLKPMLEPKPIIEKKYCITCGDCIRYCPPKAIALEEGKPKIDMAKCIRCYCCQELCPEKAIQIARNWAFRFNR